MWLHGGWAAHPGGEWPAVCCLMFVVGMSDSLWHPSSWSHLDAVL